MVYDSLDILPVKLFFQILEREEPTMLSTDRIKNYSDLKKTWERLKKEYEELDPETKNIKFFSLYRKLEELNARYKFISLALQHLAHFEDKELEDELKSKGFKFTGDSERDLKVIARNLNSIEVKLARIKAQLPKMETKKENDRTSIDEAILGFSTIAGLGYIDTNTISVIQFYSIRNIANQKIKSLEKNGK